MKKGIDKEQIIDEALNLIKDNEDIRSINMRQIARNLGCAHTNIYNYFDSFENLLYEAHISLLKIASDSVHGKMLQTDSHSLKLQYFFSEFVDFYLNNKGWFRLAWVETIGSSIPKNNELATIQTVNDFADNLIDIWEHIHNTRPSKKKMKYALHNVHCYIHGEISIYIANRSLITEQNTFKKYVVEQSVKILRLLLESDL